MNCERFDGRISCFTTLGQTESWRECEKNCSSKNMKIFSIALFFKSEHECPKSDHTQSSQRIHLQVVPYNLYAFDKDFHSSQ